MRASEFITNPDGSVYHLHLHAEDLADTILLVGDQNRVPMVSKHFDRLDVQKSKREFQTHTGWIGAKRLTVLSTGIGTDNVDIVLNEVDALVNLDPVTHDVRDDLQCLRFIRLGTSGTLRREIAVDSLVLSRGGLGLDCLDVFYNSDQLTTPAWFTNLKEALGAHPIMRAAYGVNGADGLLEHFRQLGPAGVTVTCSGFYGPQGRTIRLETPMSTFLDALEDFTFEDVRITNLEMETAGIYLLAGLLGHEALSINTILANRRTGEFSADPHQAVEQMITQALELIVTLP